MTPFFQPTALSCRCGHEWTAHLPFNVPVAVWGAHVKALHCPACGGGTRKIMFGQRPKETPVDTGVPIATRLAAWQAGADTGLSSKTIAAVMSGADVGEGDYPRDPSDLGRCLRLLRLIPEWKDRMPIMGGLNLVWAALVARWDVLESALDYECGIFGEKAKSAPKTYALMREIIEGARVA